VKVLSVKNPWAFLTIHYGKNIENRFRKTNYRGRIAIHASRKSAEWAFDTSLLECQFEKGLISSTVYFALQEASNRRAEIENTNGKIIGTVELYNCTYSELTKAANNSPWAEPDAAWHYWLKDPVALAEPIPARGMLGLWEYEGLEA
jgi:hypothetical protein